MFCFYTCYNTAPRRKLKIGEIFTSFGKYRKKLIFFLSRFYLVLRWIIESVRNVSIKSYRICFVEKRACFYRLPRVFFVAKCFLNEKRKKRNNLWQFYFPPRETTIPQFKIVWKNFRICYLGLFLIICRWKWKFDKRQVSNKMNKRKLV